MRAIWLVLGACSHAAAPPPAPLAPPPPAAEHVEPVTPATKLYARVGTSNGSWTDVVVDGIDDAAHQLCVRLVARELAVPAPVRFTILRDCAAERLPRVASSGFVLVMREDVDQDSFLIDDIMSGTRDLADAEPAHGTLLHAAPFADRTSCEAMIVKADADDQRDWLRLQQDQTRFVDEQLRDAIDRETSACAELATLQQRCAKLRGLEREGCDAEARSTHVVCDEYAHVHKELEAWQHKPHVQPKSSRRCRPR